MTEIRTYTHPDRRRYVPTSKTTGYIKLRMAPREIPIFTNREIGTDDRD